MKIRDFVRYGTPLFHYLTPLALVCPGCALIAALERAPEATDTMALMKAGPSMPRLPAKEDLKFQVNRNASGRIRQAVRGLYTIFGGVARADSSSDNNVTVLQRLQHKVDLRNTDRGRLTSLSWAAIEGALEVFEWLLVDYGHDDQELSRVRGSRLYCRSCC